ncbi:Ras GTPase [Pelomyxa schiedti]|nr:Ras GTPase [Pelomyxa schiedti]
MEHVCGGLSKSIVATNITGQETVLDMGSVTDPIIMTNTLQTIGVFKISGPLKDVMYEFLDSNRELLLCSGVVLVPETTAALCAYYKLRSEGEGSELPVTTFAGISLDWCDELKSFKSTLIGKFFGKFTVNLMERSFTLEVAQTIITHLLHVAEFTLTTTCTTYPEQAAISLLASHIVASSTLQVLNLSVCALQPESISLIASALMHNKTLQDVCLDRNPIGDIGATYLVKGLSENSSLKNLSLCSCSIGESGAMQIAQLLEKRNLVVCLEGNSIGLRGFEAIHHFSLVDNPIHNAPIRIALIGEGGVGSKSSMSIRYVEGYFTSDYSPTIEDTYTTKRLIDGVPVTLDINDTAGQEEFSSLRDRYIKTCEVISLGYSVTSRDSFEYIQALHRTVLHVKDTTDYPKVLVGGKSDLELYRQVSREEDFSLCLESVHYEKWGNLSHMSCKFAG